MPFLVLHLQFVGVYSCCFSVKCVGCIATKTERMGGKKHAETKPVTRPANRQNMLHQTYCCYFFLLCKQNWTAYNRKKDALPHFLTHPKIISVYLQDASDLCICQFATRSPTIGVNMVSNFIGIVVLQKDICNHLDMKLECGIKQWIEFASHVTSLQ